MTAREIVIYPDIVLKKKCEKVILFDDELRMLVEDMAETMYAAPGVGLAANQIGISSQICVIDIGEEGSGLHVFVNPEILETSGIVEWEEGCLSFPDITVSVTRSASLVVSAQDIHGRSFQLSTDGLMAIALQHEIDHLNGISLADKVGYLRRQLITKDLMKRKRSRSAP